VGNKVHINLRQSTDSGHKLRTAVGRGLPLIEHGVAAPLGCDAYLSKAARPRTMVGWTKAGAWRTFIVPGKLFTGPGLREGGFGLAMEAAIAKKLGLWQAYELDGGGSTTMYTQNRSGKWARRDLYGLDKSTGTYEREMPNGLAFKVP
ncbi:MAG TPA: phosphodiester glycosidase family protein, partial [Actinomycetes bacterium]|nr:phosphodiester glycosidase family protein [Actinomycetes bacterium]